MAEPRRVSSVRIDDEDLERRNEALIIENDILKEELADTQESLTELARRIAALYGVQTIGVLTPDQVQALYSDIEVAIRGFVLPMDRFLRDDDNHKARVMAAMMREGSAKAFRTALSTNAELQAAAIDSDTCVIDIWVAYLWRFLLQRVFSEDAILDFYSVDGQNATYYIKNLNEMEYLMTQAEPPVFGLYCRRLWKRQALSAIFRTADFEWVRSNRAAKIDELSQILQRAFRVFARPFPEGRPLELIRSIVEAAVRLNEHSMIEADDIWTIELEGVNVSEDDFYDKIDDFDLKPVGTLQDLGDNVPLADIKQRFSMDMIKDRMKKLCVVRPALRYQHVEPDGESYGDPVHVVKAEVLVSLKQMPMPEGTMAEYVMNQELVFYTMAKNLGLIPEPLETR